MSDNNNLDFDKLDPVAQFMINHLKSAKPNDPVSPEQVAKAFAETVRRENDGANLWRKYFNAVKQQAIFLARNDVIELTRRGEVVDPDNFKGLIRLRIKK
ncbi:MAG: DUF3253 domain-containing protein [Alphaproteobacteria bacterium]